MNADEDESLWETLEHEQLEEPLETQTRIQQEAFASSTIRTPAATGTTREETHASTGSSQPSPPPQPSQPSPPPQPSQSSSQSLPPRIQKIKERLETRKSLKQNLLDHPMQLFWSHFLVHFSRELWQLDVQIHVALVLILTGVLLKLCLLCTWFMWYPGLILGVALLVIPWCCLHPQMLRESVKSFLAAYSSPVLAADAIGRFLEPAQLRKLATALLFVPTVLEMRTMHFLSQIQAQQQQDSFYWSLYNCSIAGIVLAVMFYLLQVQHCAPRECTQKGLLVLYLSALLQTVVHFNNLFHLLLLLGPFLVATGVLILANLPDDDMEWFATAVRRALRLTLQDVLASVSVSVQQDEMLQLAMLRWIVDYWSHTEKENESNNNDSYNVNRPGRRPATTNSQADETPNDDGLGRVVRRAVTSPQQRSESTRSSSSNNLVRARGHQHELQWDELWSMLSMTTEQMACEVDSLQHVNRVDNDATTCTSSQRRLSQYESQSTYQSASHQQSNDSTRSAGGTRTSATPFMGSGAPSTSASSSATPNKYSSVKSLQSMLSSMDIDETAKPAVMAYKRRVEAFPPSRNTAVLLSVARRCPALLTVLWQIVFGLSGSFTCTMILFPFILFEMLRIQAWSDACQRSSMRAEDSLTSESKGETETTTYIGNLDPMTILLSGDDYSARNPPTLLVVWRNMRDSVSALEVGLTAARCVQTTVVAVDFAANIISLAQFGFEVSRQGWTYGLAVVLKEMLHLHTNSTAGSRSPDAKYTNAAMDALMNSQRVGRNVRILMYEEDAGRVLAPIFNIIPVLLGQGWLWARREVPSPSTRSTVEITELEESDNLLARPFSFTADQVYTSSSSVRSIVSEDASNLESTPPASHGLSEIEADNPHQPSIMSEPQESIGKETKCLSDLSVIMELIATCNERGLLSEADKNKFCENLATVGGANGPSVEWLEGSTRTLQGLLDIDSDDTVANMEQPCPDEPCPPPEDFVSTEHQKDHEIPKTSVLDARQHFDSGAEDDSDFVPLDSGDDIASQVGGPQRKNTFPPENSAPSRDSKTGGHAAPPESGIPEGDDGPKSPRSDDEDENIWLKVGSGIAVLGAVVGGVALAMGQQGKDQSRSQARRQNRSTVQIEELSDNDEGGDDWVAVPASSPSTSKK